MQPNNFISQEFKIKLRDELILPHLEEKIRYSLKTETCWATTSLVCWVISTIVLVTSSIFAFASSQFPDLPMGFIAGILIVLGTGFKDFTYFATNLDHIKTIEINNMLKNMDIDFTIIDQSKLIQQGIMGEVNEEKDDGNV